MEPDNPPSSCVQSDLRTQEQVPRVKWDRGSIQALLAFHDIAVKHAILAIYSRQTQEERREGCTTKRNGMGFGAFDAEYFTMRAKDILAGREFTHGLADAARRRGIGRYWRQLAEIANERERMK